MDQKSSKPRTKVEPDPVVLGKNQRWTEHIKLGNKVSGFVDPVKFTGFYPLDPYRVVPEPGDRLVNGQAETKSRFSNYPTPANGDISRGCNVAENYKACVPLPGETKASFLKRLWSDLTPGVLLKNKWLTYRKIAMEHPTDNPKKCFFVEVNDLSDAIMPGDIIADDKIFSKLPIPYYDFMESIEFNTHVVVSAECPDVNRMVSSYIMDHSSYTTIYRMVVAGPYGISTRLPLNPSYSEPLPLP